MNERDEIVRLMHEVAAPKRKPPPLLVMMGGPRYILKPFRMETVDKRTVKPYEYEPGPCYAVFCEEDDPRLYGWEVVFQERVLDFATKKEAEEWIENESHGG